MPKLENIQSAAAAGSQRGFSAVAAVRALTSRASAAERTNKMRSLSKCTQARQFDHWEEADFAFRSSADAAGKKENPALSRVPKRAGCASGSDRCVEESISICTMRNFLTAVRKVISHPGQTAPGEIVCPASPT